MLRRALAVLLLASAGAWAQIVRTVGAKTRSWEAGSFGITGCHGRNLLHPDNAQALQGARLAFAQGGNAGFKLVYLTPSVTAVRRGWRVEANWAPGRPFNYEQAPLLIDMDGKTDFPFVKKMLKGVNRGAWTSKFLSKFRTRSVPLDAEDGRVLAEVFDGRAVRAHGKELAASYVEAMPYAPARIEKDRFARLSAIRKSVAAEVPEDLLAHVLGRLSREKLQAKERKRLEGLRDQLSKNAANPKRYKIIFEDGKTYLSSIPGRFAGWRPGKVFGRLDCESGKRLMKKENRVFFLTYADAIKAGYRPCKKCRPQP